nr:metal ABC transporter permease [Actinomadura rayongensis]
MEMFQLDFMRIAFAMAVLIGLTAPVIGTFVVQRKMSLLGDGIGHIALTGIGLGLVTGSSPVLAALVVSVLGAVAIEALRARSRSGADVALAVLFYGGLAGGVVLTGREGGQVSLQSYLFGSISSVTATDLYIVAGLSAAVLLILAIFGRELFLLCQDEDLARAAGLPVRFLSVLIAATAAVTVVISMRAIGLLLVSALMIVPVAAAQQVARGFLGTMLTAMAAGVLSAVTGLAGSYEYDLAPGPSIVLLALAVFLAAVGTGTVLRRRRTASAAARDARAARRVDVRDVSMDAEPEVLGG